MSNVPTGPGWWYRDEEEPCDRVAWVSFVTVGGLVSYVSRRGNEYDEENTKWRGPVPMPGVDFEPCPTCGKIGEKHYVKSPYSPTLICDNGHEWEP